MLEGAPRLPGLTRPSPRASRRGPWRRVRGPVWAGVPRLSSAAGAAPPPPPPPRVCLEKKAGQFVFIQNHLRSHFGEMKGGKRASRARPAGCPLVPGGALGGRHPSPPLPRRGHAPAPGSRPAGPRGQAALICMKRTLAAHLQGRN